MEFLEVPLFDADLFKLMIRLTFDLLFVFLVVRFAYYQHQANKSLVFSFLLMNVLIFFICFTLKKLDLGLGMALGLFAIFSIVRFRTDAISVKDMTYLFLVIGLAVINALSNKKTSYAELLFTNTFIFMIAYLMERFFMYRKGKPAKTKPVKNKLSSQELVYDNLDLLRPERSTDLLNDLASRTGFDVQTVSVKKIDLSKGTAAVIVKYSAAPKGPSPVESKSREHQEDSPAPKTND